MYNLNLKLKYYYAFLLLLFYINSQIELYDRPTLAHGPHFG